MKGEKNVLEKPPLNKDNIEVINLFLDLFNISMKLQAHPNIRSDYIEKYNLLKERGKYTCFKYS